ncbi:MAG TPA: lactate permease LctP family transporter [Vicinamibacterales bacterium]|jgi:lactate permease|nr:lactate permease LctP family transporter [Vicinamibacterales bacterium]
MWQQNYEPVGGSLGLSAAVASIPILVLFFMLGVRRKPAWMAAITALAVAFVLAIVAYHMPFQLAVTSTVNGAAYGIFPIAWIVFASIMLYRLAVDTGKFEVIKDSVGGLTNDRRLQALFIAFSFGAFIEGAAGFGAPVAVSGAMLAGLGFAPFYAAGICLLANTAPVAFGSIGIPIVTLAGITGLPAMALSAMVGRLCAMISVIIPAYLLLVMVGLSKTIEVLPAVLVCGLSFASVQFYVSNYVGPELTDILSSLTCIACTALVLKLWKPKNIFRLEGEKAVTAAPHRHTGGEVFVAWMPYLLLVAFVLAWGEPAIKLRLDRFTNGLLPGWLPRNATALNGLNVPGLHNLIMRVPPVTNAPAPYAAVFAFNWLSASGTACFFATIAAALFLGVGPARFGKIYTATFKQLAKPMLTIATMLGLAYLMNYSGMTSTLGLALAATGWIFPFFSAILGWLGVFLTGSDTSANALFGNLQVITANQLAINPVLTASVNSAAGVMGKMISLTSIAVAVAATGLTSEDEGKLFRFTIKHSVFLACVVGVVAMLYAYVFPGLVPIVPPK